jgi:hypothetical protein
MQQILEEIATEPTRVTVISMLVFGRRPFPISAGKLTTPIFFVNWADSTCIRPLQLPFRSSQTHCHQSFRRRFYVILDTKSVAHQGRPEACGRPGSLIIWRSLKPIFFNFLVYNRAEEHSGERVSEVWTLFGEIFCAWNAEFTSTVFPIISDTLQCPL